MNKTLSLGAALIAGLVLIGCKSEEAPAVADGATTPSASTTAPVTKPGKAPLTRMPAPTLSASAADADARVGSALGKK